MIDDARKRAAELLLVHGYDADGRIEAMLEFAAAERKAAKADYIAACKKNIQEGDQTYYVAYNAGVEHSIAAIERTP